MRIKVWTQRIILGAALGFGALQGGKCVVKKLTAPDPASQLIAPPSGKDKLFGLFANHVTDGRHLACLETATGLKSDLSVRYLSLGEPFPKAEAELMDKQGGALLIRLKLKPRELQELLKGNADILSGLEKTNGDIKQFGRRVMIGIDPGKLGASPALRPAFERVIEELDAENITWIWHPTLGDPPAGLELKWTMADLFQQALPNGSIPSFAELAPSALAAAEKSGLNIVLNIGSKADEAAKLQFLTDAVEAALPNERVKAIVLYNASNRENLQLSPSSLEKLGAVLKKHEPVFAADLAGQPAGPFTPQLPSWEERAPLAQPDFSPAWSQLKPYIVNQARLNSSGFYTDHESNSCEDVGKRFYTIDDLQKEMRTRKQLYDLERKLPDVIGTIYEGPFRQDLAKEYLALAAQTSVHKHRIALIQKAYDTLDIAFSWAQGHRTSDGIRIEPGYLDMKVQIALIMAETLQVGSLNTVEQECDRIVAILEGNRTKVEEAIANYSYTVGGYTSRLDLVRGTVLERSQKYYDAKGQRGALSYFQSALDWAVQEDQPQTATIATLGKTRIFLGSGSPELINAVPGMLQPLYSYEDLFDATEGRGFMDRGFETLIQELQAAMLLSGGDEQKAREIFTANVPWEKLDESEDLLKAFELKPGDLLNPDLDRAQLVLEALTRPQIKLPNDTLTTLLGKLREFYGI